MESFKLENDNGLFFFKEAYFDPKLETIEFYIDYILKAKHFFGVLVCRRPA
jgi:hypothetical protein